MNSFQAIVSQVTVEVTARSFTIPIIIAWNFHLKLPTAYSISLDDKKAGD
ncbi:MAG: hypothetical protein IPG09_15315 [Ignavibacteria bacterium]|nr:hypothetical protein [Ignavibacteria bacterium]